MEDLLKYLISPLLTVPDDLMITVTDYTYTIKVNPQDTGRIIGKHGSVINSIRTLAKVYASTHQLSFTNLILDAPIPPAPSPKKD